MPGNVGGGSGPIKIDPGKGWWVRLPVPTKVAENLGGASHLGDRLRPVVTAQADIDHDLTPTESESLASAYAELLRSIQEIPAVTEKPEKPKGGPEVPGTLDNPITVDPGKGWWVIVPVPEKVISRLGGPSEMRERLDTVLGIQRDTAKIGPQTSDRITSAYSELVEQLEEVTRRGDQ